MSLTNAFIKAYLRPRIGRIEHATHHAAAVQRRTLMYLIHKAKHTEWGKMHAYNTIHSKKDYVKNVPVSTYEEIKPFIQKTFNGEQNVLWPDTIRWFSKSSGTTDGRSKYIPVSRDSLEYTHYRSGKDVSAMFLKNHPYTDIFGGKCLMLTGTVSQNPEYKKGWNGDISGVLVKKLPGWINFMRTPSRDIALLPDWEEKINRIIESTQHVDVRFIGGVPSWMLVLMNRILDVTGKKDIREVWPGLQLFIHGAVNFSPYRVPFRQVIPHDDMYFYETYNASEGFFALQDNDNPGEMRLMVDYGIYYEFIPMDEIHLENPRTLTLQEIELDTNYALVISTNGGLWRYKIGDTIKFTSKKPYRIMVTGRTKHFINVFGEELMVENAERAIEYASQRTKSLVKEFTAAPIYLSNDHSGAHEWLIEFENEPEDIEFFTDMLDDKLKEINSDYEAKRYGNYILQRPLIRVLPKDSFYTWMKHKGKLGAQQKIPRLQNDRKQLEEIVQVVESFYKAT